MTVVVNLVKSWMPVRGFEEKYEVSPTGQIKSLRSGKILKGTPDGFGHLKVGLYTNGVQKKKSIHRVVAENYLGDLPENKETRHLDGNEKNNSVTNLAYGSRSQNTLDAVRHGTNFHASKTHCPSGHEYSKENTYRRPSGHRECRTCLRERAFARRSI